MSNVSINIYSVFIAWKSTQNWLNCKSCLWSWTDIDTMWQWYQYYWLFHHVFITIITQWNSIWHWQTIRKHWMLHSLKPNLTSSMRKWERWERGNNCYNLDFNSHKNTLKVIKMSLNPNILIIWLCNLTNIWIETFIF